MSKGGVPFDRRELAAYRDHAHTLGQFVGKMVEEHLNSVLTIAARDGWDGDVNELFSKSIAEYMRITLDNHDGGEDALGEANTILRL